VLLTYAIFYLTAKGEIAFCGFLPGFLT